MEIHKYNRLKAASKRVQSEVSFDSAEWEQARPQVKIVLAEKEKTGTWLSEQMGHNISTVSRWMTNRSASGTLPKQEGSATCVNDRLCYLSKQEFYEIVHNIYMDVKEVFVSP